MINFLRPPSLSKVYTSTFFKWKILKVRNQQFFFIDTPLPKSVYILHSFKSWQLWMASYTFLYLISYLSLVHSLVLTWYHHSVIAWELFIFIYINSVPIALYDKYTLLWQVTLWETLITISVIYSNPFRSILWKQWICVSGMHSQLEQKQMRFSGWDGTVYCQEKHRHMCNYGIMARDVKFKIFQSSGYKLKHVPRYGNTLGV